MIKTATQLKAKIRNLSGGDNDRARVLIRILSWSDSWNGWRSHSIETISS